MSNIFVENILVGRVVEYFYWGYFTRIISSNIISKMLCRIFSLNIFKRRYFCRIFFPEYFCRGYFREDIFLRSNTYWYFFFSNVFTKYFSRVFLITNHCCSSVFKNQSSIFASRRSLRYAVHSRTEEVYLLNWTPGKSVITFDKS